MAETLDEADPGRPHSSDMRATRRNFLLLLLLNRGKEQEYGGRTGIATLLIREFLGLGLVLSDRRAGTGFNIGIKGSDNGTSSAVLE
jgi:hypothetical protein